MKEFYRDHEINFTIEHRFLVKGPLFEGYSNIFDSWKEATEAIDEAVKIKSLEEKPTLVIDVLDEEGKDIVIRGIHGNTSEMLTKPSTRSGNVYPSLPHLRQLLARRATILEEARNINKVVDKYRMTTRRGYGRVGSETKLNAMLQAIIDEHAKLLKEAGGKIEQGDESGTVESVSPGAHRAK